MKLRIVSGGTGHSTRVETENGEPVEQVVRVIWSCKVGEIAKAWVLLNHVEVDVAGEGHS